MTTKLNDALATRGTPTTGVPAFTTPAALGTLGNPAGRVPSRRAGQEATRQDFGREYLFHWLNGLENRATQTVALVGDSNAASGYTLGLAGDLIATAPAVVTVTNYARSGTMLSDWVNGVNGYASTSMAAVLATNPDLLLLGFSGTNDPFYGKTGEQFITDLDNALTTIRASANGSVGRLSIVLFTSSTMDDGLVNAGTADMRDEMLTVRIRPLIAALALKHKCGFFDRYSRLPDASIDFAPGSVGVNTWLDANRVHPQGAHRAILAREFYEWVVPAVYRENLLSEVVPTAPFAKPANVENMRVTREHRHCLLEGYLNGPGTTVTAGTIIGTIPLGFRPYAQVLQSPGAVFGSALPAENITLTVSQAGVITIVPATTQIVNRVYVRAPFSAY